MIVMPVLISRIKIAMGESEIGDISKDPQRSTAPGLVLQLEQPARQHHPLLPLSPGASGGEPYLLVAFGVGRGGIYPALELLD